MVVSIGIYVGLFMQCFTRTCSFSLGFSKLRFENETRFFQNPIIRKHQFRVSGAEAYLK